MTMKHYAQEKWRRAVYHARRAYWGGLARIFTAMGFYRFAQICYTRVFVITAQNFVGVLMRILDSAPGAAEQPAEPKETP